MALLGIIRRWYIRDRVSIREIARRLDISRNTVRRYIRSEAIEPSYASRHSPSSLDAYAPRLSAWLSSELVKSRKQRRTLKQMFLELRGLGYEGSYDRVAAFSRQWKAGQLERVKSASKSTKQAIYDINKPLIFQAIGIVTSSVEHQSIALKLMRFSCDYEHPLFMSSSQSKHHILSARQGN
ncbi:helix-turn-helix domain-containing protein [Herbaspirillum huttiense]|uniref:helix-turn-helix domain-containing protein n=1 Tax=Herbaspirillum huttiense TaxID=863372 RepID=UPI0035C67B01